MPLIDCPVKLFLRYVAFGALSQLPIMPFAQTPLLFVPLPPFWGLPVGSVGKEFAGNAGKRLPAMQETWVRSLGWEDPLEKEMGTHSSILAWRIPWTEEPRHSDWTSTTTAYFVVKLKTIFFLLKMRFTPFYFFFPLFFVGWFLRDDRNANFMWHLTIGNAFDLHYFLGVTNILNWTRKECTVFLVLISVK